MKLVVTGKQGQLARALEERCAAGGVESVLIGRPEVDSRDGPALASALEASRGDIIINAAAYTAVDKAESEPELAMAINRDGARSAAVAAARIGIPIIQLSTDYVFNGRLDRPYREDDPVDPLSVYGRTKLAGERAVSQANPRHTIVRTSWVYSPFGQNFVRTMLRLGETRDRLDVVADQWGSPSSAIDLADALIAMGGALLRQPGNSDLSGIFHVTGSGATNWAGFAQAVFAEAAALGRAKVAVEPISTAQYPTAATRPANSRMDGNKLERAFGLRLPDWRISVAGCVRRLLET
jgi:dTDP-4-dehydrorhamnose reductase